MLAAASALLYLLGATEPTSPAREVNRTLADLRTIATAIEAYAADYQRYPEAQTFGELKEVIEPKYIVRLTGKDAWGTDLRYIVNRNGSRYRIVSAGADQVFETGFEQIQCEPIEQAVGRDGS